LLLQRNWYGVLVEPDYYLVATPGQALLGPQTNKCASVKDTSRWRYAASKNLATRTKDTLFMFSPHILQDAAIFLQDIMVRDLKYAVTLLFNLFHISIHDFFFMLLHDATHQC
jgi:hypothetical protein